MEGKEMVCLHYKLKEDKLMGDGSVISAGTLLREVFVEKDMINVETIEDSTAKKFFWVNKTEVTFLEEKKVFISNSEMEILEKVKHGKWL